MIKRFFWDSQQHRIRMFWRLVLQTLLFILLTTTLPLLSMIGTTILSGGPATSASADWEEMPEVMPLLRFTMLIGTLGSVWLAGRFLDRRKFVDFGFRLTKRWWKDLAFGLFLGAFLMCCIFVSELAAGWITVSGFLLTPTARTEPFLVGIVLALFYFIAVGIQEELLSRGYQTKNLAEGLHGLVGTKGAIILAAVLSSALFGYLHAANPNATAISTFNIVLAGLFLALGFLLTGELAIPIGIHITWNFFQGNVFGFPVSGMQRDLSFIGVQQGGDTLVTGGMFGPEAGLIGIGAMLLGSILIVLWTKAQHGKAGLHEQLVQPDLRPRRG